MKLHLPVRLFKSVLACLAAVASFSLGSGVAWAEAQNLTFSGSSLTWDTSTENKYFVDEEDAAASFAAGDNVSFTSESTVTLGENITVGTLDIAAGADVTIDLGEYTLHTNIISLSGTLDVGDSLSIASGSTLAVKNAAAVLDSALVLGEKSGLVVESTASLNNNSLTLHGGSNLILTAAGDGKTYTLLTGISSLLDKNGDTLAAGSYSINDYFDKSAPGSGFWADATLVLTVDGTLQLVRHEEEVQESLVITTRQPDSKTYNYYECICFRDITYASDSSSASGGALGDNTVTLNDNGSIAFSGIMVSSSASYAYGGAIWGETVTLRGNGDVTFSGNSVYAESEYSNASGGAICGNTVTLNDNGSVVFSGNSAATDSIHAISSPVYGGAIRGDFSITLNGNGSVEFSNNSVSSSTALVDAYGSIDSPVYGGAIWAANHGSVTLSSNGSVTFSGNSASAFTTSSAAWGGAIYCGNLTMSDNGSVTFSGNSASSTCSSVWGGAIFGDTTLSNNGSVTFSGNTASGDAFIHGGAIYGDITLSNNGSVTFSGNTASSSSSKAEGGAIYTNGSLHICNNDSVEFAGNVEKRGSTYRLRSVYVYGGSGGVLDISAAAGKSVAFYDSIYVGSDATVNLNADYEDAEGNIIEQKGDIVFTGATTVNDLYKAKGNVNGTEEEILLSRTMEVNTMTNLYGGRLRVEDGAIYQGYGITAKENSKSTVLVKDAVLSHSGFALTFNAGTTLQVQGESFIVGM